MKKVLTLAAAALLLAGTALAVPAKPGIRTVTQSDGTTLQVQQLGDEFHHSLATADGLTIEQGDDGGYYYCSAKGITTMRAHDAASRSTAEQAFLAQNQGEFTFGAQQSAAQRARARQASAPRRVGQTQVPTMGSPRVPIILVEYKDKKMSNTVAAFEQQYKTGAKSVLKYFTDQSNGQYTPQYDIYGIYALPSNRSTYGGNSGGNDKGVALMVCDAIDKAGNDIDWSLYDNDGDGEADVCIVVYAGVGEAQSSVSNSVWPCQWSLSSGAYYGDGSGAQTRNGVTIDKFAVFNEIAGSSDYGTTMDGIGTFCHEFSHCLGLPDFYETTYSNGYYGMGNWSLMDSGCYNGGTVDGDTPIGYSAYEKNFMGWIDLITPVAGTKYTLLVFNQGGNDQALRITALNDNEYWVLENRRKQGWDQYIADEGVLITHFTYVASRWDDNTVNNKAIQLATVVPADNSLSSSNETRDLFGETNHAFTSTSSPAMKANMKANGTLASSTGGAGAVDKPVNDIYLNSDGTASLWYIKDAAPDPVTLTAPVMGEATEVGQTSFVANWTHTPAISCTYTLQVTRGTAVVAEVTGLTDLFYNVTELTAGTSYTVKVKAVPVYAEQGTESEWSNAVNVTTAAASTLPLLDTPVMADASEVTGTSFKASWTHSATPACTYTLMVQNSYGGVVLEQEGITAKSYVVTDMIMGGTYTFRVKAVPVDATTAQESLWSADKTVTLPTEPGISVDITNVEITCAEGSEGRGSFMISGEYLDENTDGTITLNDPNGVFRLGKTVVSGYSIMAGAVINVYFTPENAGTYQATATVNFPGCDPIVVNINGTATMVKDVPVMSEASDIHPTSFRATWTPVRHAQSYTLYVDQQSQGAVELLSEDFTGLTQSSTVNIGNYMDNFLSNPGWTGKRVFLENGALRLNERTAGGGYITTPELDLSGSGGLVTVKINAKAYSTSDNNVWLTVKTDNDSKQINLTNVATDYTVVVGCTAAEGQKVTIAARDESRKRALLYNVSFFSGDATAQNAPARIAEQGDSTSRVITGITDATYVVSDLAREGTFNFKVEAVYTDGTTSAASNIETVTLGGDDEPVWKLGDVNADGNIDVLDMNILINIVLEKDNADNYERRAYIMGGDTVGIEDINALINILLAQ